ncbi:MAG: stage II sporulation protein R [Ruminococcaceae bacterium]|nr:stage II sporulation protein R [Oscillospiraceae bacterium]
MEKKAFTVLLIAVSLTLVIGLIPIHGEHEIYDSVVRLHVLANSDSEEDQNLKLLVRDDIIALTNTLLAGCTTREEALTVISENLDLYSLTAEKTLRKNGSDYSVSISLGEEYYPTRVYEGSAFPGGEYVSLQIKIGEAEGKNWWCVLFPPICLSVAGGAANEKKNELEGAFIAAGLTPEQYRIITETENDGATGKYKIRFKILEIFEEIGKLFK